MILDSWDEVIIQKCKKAISRFYTAKEYQKLDNEA